MTAIQTQPYSSEAEQALLGSVLINPSAYFEVRDFMRGEYFYLHKHRWIWDAATAILDGNGMLDCLSLSDKLGEHRLKEIGGMAYLTELISCIPTSLHVEAYGKIVHREAVRRMVLESAAAIARLAYTEGKDTEEMVAEARAALRAVEGHGISCPNTLYPISELIGGVYDTMVDYKSIKESLLPTHLLAVDRMLGGGLERKTLTVIMSRPNMGKSAALVQIADLASEAGKNVLVFSLEMSKEQWVRRTVLRRCGISWDAFKSGNVSSDQMQKFIAEASAIRERNNLYIDEEPRTTDDIERICDKFSEERGQIDYIIADHLKLFSNKGDNETHRMGRVSWGLKKIAKAWGAAVIAAAQLNRALENQNDKRPDLKDLRDSGEIEENSDNAIAQYRDAYYNPGSNDRTVEFWLRKGREGARNDVAKMVFIPDIMHFARIAGQV